MATFEKRGDYQWRVKIRRQGYPQQTRTFETRADGEKWARAVEREMDTASFLDRREAEKSTFGEVLKRYRREITPAKKGARNEEIIIDTLLRHKISKLKMTALTGSSLAGWRDERLQYVSGGTVNREIDVISAVVNQARKEWGIHIENPIQLMRRPPRSKARDRRFENDEEARLLDALSETERRGDGTFAKGARNPWLRPVVEFAIETAMRRGELLALRWQDVDLKSRVAHLYDTKNGSDRDVPLSSRAVAILSSLPRSISGMVFPISRDSLKKGFERAVVRACIEDFRFHDLRHEATSRLALTFTNILELGAVTGHKDLRMLKRYYHPRAQDLAKKLA